MPHGIVWKTQIVKVIAQLLVQRIVVAILNIVAQMTHVGVIVQDVVRRIKCKLVVQENGLIAALPMVQVVNVGSYLKSFMALQINVYHKGIMK